MLAFVGSAPMCPDRSPANELTVPMSFDEVWRSVPVNIQLLLLHLKRAEDKPEVRFAL